MYLFDGRCEDLNCPTSALGLCHREQRTALIEANLTVSEYRPTTRRIELA